MPELEATAPAIPFWFYRVVAGAAALAAALELGGRLRQQADRNRWGNRPASLWIAEDLGCCA
jgi:hypothetical protein